MVKKFSVPCDFGGARSPFTIYIGAPEPSHHPLHFQAEWLSKYRGGTIPGEVMESINKLFELSKKNNVSFEELCEYALGSEDGAEEPPSPEEEKFGQAPPPPGAGGGSFGEPPAHTPTAPPASDNDFDEVTSAAPPIPQIDMDDDDDFELTDLGLDDDDDFGEPPAPPA